MSADVSSPPLMRKRQLEHPASLDYDLAKSRKFTSNGSNPFANSSGLKRGYSANASPEIENSRTKRVRTMLFQPSNEEASFDIPVYSQRQADMMEQRRQQEIAKLQQEIQAYAEKKEEELQRAVNERDHFRSKCEEMNKEIVKLQEQGKILKRAVTIQNQQKQETSQENEALKGLLHQAADQIRRLEQTNYALKVHLQTISPGMGDFGSQGPLPPNVF